MKVKFIVAIFQEGKVDEVKGFEQEFADPQELARALVKFAATESALRLDPGIQMIFANWTEDIHLPSARRGYGPRTNVIIEQITFL